MLLKDGEKMRCPICGGTVFCATAHVTQDWELDEMGAFQKCLNDCIEVTHFPNAEDIWDCKKCGYSNAGHMKMPKENIDTSMFAPCGMNCLVCYKHCYHKKPCAGCLNSDKGKPEHCRKCKIKDCTSEKNISYCFECSEYPCKLIKNLEKSYNKRYRASLIENSDFVRQHGLEIFMEEQKERYTCPKCGGIISLHDRECSECQEKGLDKLELG